MAVGRECARRAFEFFLWLEAEGVREPTNDVAALAQRAAQHNTAAIDAVDERSPGHGDALAIQQHAQGARGSNRGARPARTDAARANIRQATVTEGEIPPHVTHFRRSAGKARPQRASRLIPIGQRREMLRRDAGQTQGGSVPLTPAYIQQPGPGYARVADAGVVV